MQQNSVQSLLNECERLEIQVRFPDLVSESDAAQLLGYASADTLRKQVQEQRGRLDYFRRGNRRFYSLADIARILSE